MAVKQLFISTVINRPIWDINNRSRRSIIVTVKPAVITSFLQQSDSILIVFFTTRFQRTSDCNYRTAQTEAMFTLYRIVKRSVAESVPDRASVHTRTAAFETVSAPEQYCSAPLLKVERFVSNRFLRRSESSLNTFIGAEIATEPRFGKLSFQIKRERCKLHNG